MPVLMDSYPQSVWKQFVSALFRNKIWGDLGVSKFYFVSNKPTPHPAVAAMKTTEFSRTVLKGPVNLELEGNLTPNT